MAAKRKYPVGIQSFEKIRKEGYLYVDKTQPIERAWLFGSFARGEETLISDVDILVQFDEDGVSLLKHAAMICDLEKILDRPVDIVPEKALRPRVRESINQDKKLIYERTR